MCLLIVQPKGTVWSDELIADFYTRNRDGIGVMWAQDGRLHYEKYLPKNLLDAIDFFKEHINGKECAAHLRMKTHGDIDEANCHPYEVFGFTEEHEMPMLMMHNGILHTGNLGDTSKSDSWHYVRNYLRPMLSRNPAWAFATEFKEMVGKHIGNNRFAIMNHEGKCTVVNKHQGVEFNGAWLSNEYAWSAHKYMPRPVYTNTSKWDTWKDKTRKFEEPVKKQKGSKVKTTPANRGTQTQITNAGGKTCSTSTATQSKLDFGISTNSIWLDDVLEIRDLLDMYAVGQSISNKQIECFIDNTSPQTVYFAMELLMDGLLTDRHVIRLFTSVLEQHNFADRPTTEWYPDRKRTNVVN